MALRDRRADRAAASSSGRGLDVSRRSRTRPSTSSRDRPRDEAIQQAAQRVADALAARIKDHPEFWYHFYRYWDAQDDAYDGLA